MFGAVPHSPYDIHFQVGPFPVRVTWTHWVVSAIFGWEGVNFAARVGLAEPGTPQPVFLVLWVVIVFLSILIHELGHAIAARAFGYPAEIVLYHFGGLAAFEPRRHTTFREIVISLAGPVAGFVAYGGIWLATVYGLPRLPPAESGLMRAVVWFTVSQAIFVNLYWGLVNLLPVLPLDGGRVSLAVCRAINRRDGGVWAAWVSVAAAAVATVWFWRIGMTFAGILFLFLGVQAWLGLTGRSLR